MKVLIAYSSKTGNTRKIAESIHAYQPEWTLQPLAEADSQGFDLIFLGGWIDKGTYNAETVAFAKQIKNKDVAFFFTIGAYPTSKYAFECVHNIISLLEENGNRIINHFHAQGAIAPEMKKWMQGLAAGNPHGVDRYREIRWAHAENHPNREDLDAAQNFADQTIKALTPSHSQE